MSDFVETNAEVVLNEMVTQFEAAAGRKLSDSAPELIFLKWAADIIVQLRTMIEISAKENVPSGATGEKLDRLCELFHGVKRLPATAAKTTIRFSISTTLETAHLIPRGTRVTSEDESITFTTDEDALIPAGDTYVDVPATAQVVGLSGNGYAIGTITELVDIYPFYSECSNTTVTAGGAERETDAALYIRMRESADAYSTAGAAGSYVFWAKSANPLICDAIAIAPSAGVVNIYTLLQGGELPGTEILNDVEAACSADTVRPLTDTVHALAAEAVDYEINLTYYLKRGTQSAADIATKVAAAVEEYKAWQCAKMGRDITPSKLVQMVMDCGVKRVVVTSPVYTVVSSGNSTTAAQVAKTTTASTTIVNGGYEDE